MRQYRSLQVKAREVSSMNVGIVKEWVWRERSSADVAHPARMLVADTVKSRARTKLEGSTSGQHWWVIVRYFFFHGRRGECREMLK